MHAAREVEQFAYCPHNWWLARRGSPGTSGTAAPDPGRSRAHRRLEMMIDQRSRALRWMYRVLLAATSATILTLEVVYLRTERLHWLFLAVALVLTAGSAGLLVLAGVAERRAAEHAKELGLVAGTLLAAPGGDRRPLQDPSWGVRGTPDYILQAKDGPVPVEVRSGKTPVHPFPSHQLQITAYMRLLEAAGHKRPPYGLIQYPNGIFRVDHSDELEARLRHILRRMDAAVAEGKADRDHSEAGRCLGCARRADCDQKLS